MSRNRMTNNITDTHGVTLQKLAIMEVDNNILKRIRTIQNEIATNLLYYGTNRKQLEDKYERANVKQEQQNIMFDVMNLREQIANKLLTKLSHFAKEYGIPIEKIIIPEIETGELKFQNQNKNKK